MNLDKMLFDFHTEVANLESHGRGAEAAWCAQRVAVQGLMTLGLTLSSQMGEHERADEIFGFIQRIDPGNWLAWSNMTHARSQLGDYAGALLASDRAIECSMGESHDVFYNAGVVLTNLGRTAEAEAMYRKAASIEPTKHGIAFNLGLTLLRQGKYEEGWRLYESRFLVNELTAMFKRRFAAEEWDGRSFKRKSLVVFSEQGLGDFIMFSRFLERAKRLGGRVTLEVQEPLYDIARNNFDFLDKVVARENSTTWPDVPKSDFAISVCSLPRVLKANRAEDLACEPYLRTTKRYKLEKSKRMKIGLCWCGNSDHTRDTTRSAPLRDFARLFEQKDVEIYGLVKGVRGVRNWIKGKIDLNEGAQSLPLTDLEGKFNNFDELASIVNSLDLVITVDTGLAHLCGAMGKPVWILLGRETDWRWGDGVSDSVWYPSATLFRRKTTWPDLVDEVVRALPTGRKAR